MVARWFNRRWAYPLMILVLAGFVVYQIYTFAYTHSLTLVLLTLFDLLIIWLTWREYGEQKAGRPSRGGEGARA